MSTLEEEFDRYVNKVNCPAELKEKYLTTSGSVDFDNLQEHIASFFYILGYYNAVKNMERIKRQELNVHRRKS